MKLRNFSKLLMVAALSGSLLTASEASFAAPESASKPSLSYGINQTTHYASSLWNSMSKNFGMSTASSNARVQQQIAWLVKNQASLNKMLQQAAPMISYVYHQIQKRGLPAELALLPVVESGFNPNAKSQVGASGLWQLMPKTASGLGVKTTQAYDGRKDIIASTQAAMRYLISLKQMFNSDWHLVLAAYNWGPGNVRNAVKKQTAWYKRSNYWSLNMPKETQDYVPKLLALAEIVKNPGKYGVNLPMISDQPHLATVAVTGNVDFKKISASTSISMDTLRKLNPGYTKMATANGAPNQLLVPVDKAGELKPVVTVLSTSIEDGRSYARLADQNSLQNQSMNEVDSDSTTNQNTDKTSNFMDSTNNQGSYNNTDSNAHLVKAILSEGKWLLLTLTNLPGSTYHLV